MSKRQAASLLIVCVCGVVLFGGLGATRFWDDDEGFFASCAAEMYRRGDIIVPSFNDEVFGHKPPWMYWMMMGGFSMFGVTELAARFFSAVFGMATALLTWRVGTRLFNPRVGLLAGLALPTCLMFSLVSRAATPDVFLVFFSSLSLYLFATRSFARTSSDVDGGVSAHHPQRWRDWVLIYAVMGFAVLVKGPIGFLFPMAVIGLFLLCLTPRRVVPESADRRTRWWAAVEPFGPVNFVRTVWRMRPLTAILMILIISAPWYIAVGIQTDGAFLQEFFGVHHYQRFTEPMENHSGPIFYYIVAVLIGLFPWSSFAYPTVREWLFQVRQRGENSTALIFLACWAGVYIGLFSLAGTKLPNYVLPAYPALAVISAVFLDETARALKPRQLFELRAAFWVLVAVGLVIAGGLPLAATVAIGGQTLLERGGLDTHAVPAAMSLALTGIPLIAGGFIGWWFTRQVRIRPALITLAGTSFAMVGTLWLYAAPGLHQLQTPQQMAARFSESPGDAEVAAFRAFRPSMVFYARQSVGRCRDTDEVLDFLNSARSPWLITNERGLEELGAVSQNLEIVASEPNFPKRGQVVLLRKRPELARTTGRSTLR